MNALKLIDSRIRSIRTRSGTLRQSIQECAVMIMAHAKEHGDCSRALTLVEAVPMASERAKLIQWLVAYSPINVTWAKDVTKRRVGLLKLDAKRYTPFNVEGAKVNPYYDHTNDDDDTAKLLGVGDFNDALLKLVKRFRKNIEDGKVAANDVETIEAKLVAVQPIAAVAA